MRSHNINHVLKCNVDLTKLSNRFLQISKTDNPNEYLFTSDKIKVYKCESHSFICRFIQRRLPIQHYFGNCSCPTGFVVKN